MALCLLEYIAIIPEQTAEQHLRCISVWVFSYHLQTSVFYSTLFVIRNPRYMLRTFLGFRENKALKLLTKTNVWVLHCSFVPDQLEEGIPEGLPL